MSSPPPALHPRANRTVSPRWCVILTATVHVNVDLRTEPYGQRQQRSAVERRAMYQRVLRHWLTHAPNVPITVVENSGDDLGWAATAARQLNRSRQLALVRLPN